MTSQWKMLVGGDLRDARDGATYPSISPSTGEVLGAVPSASEIDVDEAVTGAERAAADWRRVPPRERASVLRVLAGALRDHREELARLDALDGGNPVTAMVGDVDAAAELLDCTAEWVGDLAGVAPAGDSDHLHYTRREPFGVVARIIPYNHPLMFAASKLGAPLLAGNAVVLKAPDQAPLSALRLGELIREMVPPGLVSILSGAGPVVGPALVGHPAVRRVAFTGSVETGRAILRTAASAGIKSVSLELGGKNPILVLEDADIEAAAVGAVVGMNFRWTGGQSCGSTSRLLVHRRIAAEVVERILAIVAGIRVGDPLDPATEMGCMVSHAHRDRVLSYIGMGRDEGLSLVAGGHAPAEPELAGGAYVLPTVFVDVAPTSILATTEIFGPVLVVTPFDDTAEAIELANCSGLGLTASIWTRDVSEAHRVAGELQAGYVWVNTASRHFAGMPFGGVKDSGLGREESVEELHSFTQSKAVTVRL